MDCIAFHHKSRATNPIKPSCSELQWYTPYHLMDKVYEPKVNHSQLLALKQYYLHARRESGGKRTDNRTRILFCDVSHVVYFKHPKLTRVCFAKRRINDVTCGVLQSWGRREKGEGGRKRILRSGRKKRHTSKNRHACTHKGFPRQSMSMIHE